jgi:hypothetical protein
VTYFGSYYNYRSAGTLTKLFISTRSWLKCFIRIVPLNWLPYPSEIIPLHLLRCWDLCSAITRWKLSKRYQDMCHSWGELGRDMVSWNLLLRKAVFELRKSWYFVVKYLILLLISTGSSFTLSVSRISFLFFCFFWHKRINHSEQNFHRLLSIDHSFEQCRCVSLWFGTASVNWPGINAQANYDATKLSRLPNFSGESSKIIFSLTYSAVILGWT